MLFLFKKVKLCNPEIAKAINMEDGSVMTVGELFDAITFTSLPDEFDFSFDLIGENVSRFSPKGSRVGWTQIIAKKEVA